MPSNKSETTRNKETAYSSFQSQETQEPSVTNKHRVKVMALLILLLFLQLALWTYAAFLKEGLYDSSAAASIENTVFWVLFLFYAIIPLEIFLFFYLNHWERFNEKMFGYTSFDHSQRPEGKSNIRLIYLFISVPILIGFSFFAYGGYMNGEGKVMPEYMAPILGGFGVMFVGILSMIFVVRCGNCGTSIYKKKNTNADFDDPASTVAFMLKNQCPSCGINRR